MTITINYEDVEKLMKDVYKNEYPTEKRMENAIKKRYAEYEELSKRPLVDSLVIKIEWKKSRTWGYNPHAEVWIDYVGGTHEYRKGFTASGCGYDKRIAVIEHILNDVAVQNILDYLDDGMETGLCTGVVKPFQKGGLPFYELGNGFGDFLNFKSEHYAWGETFDEVHISFKQKNVE